MSTLLLTTYPHSLGSKLNYFLAIIFLILFSVKTAIADCLISEKLEGIEDTSELKVSVISSDEAYLTAGSKLYKLNNPKPIDTLENGRYYNVHKTRSGLFLVTDKHLRVMVSSNQTQTLTGIPPIDSLIDIYDTNNGTLLNFSEGLYFFDENNFTSKLLQSSNDKIVNSCVINESGFVAAIGNQVFSLTKDMDNINLAPVPGFSGLCNDMKSVQNDLFLSSSNKGFYKYNPVIKQFEALALPDSSPGAAGGIIAVNGQVLLTTMTALYHFSNNGQIELLENVGSLINAYARPENIILHSLKGLFIWDEQQEIQAITGFQSESLNIFNSKQAVFVQKDQDLYIIGSHSPQKISVNPSLTVNTNGSLKIHNVLGSKSGTLFATNVGILYLAPESTELKRLPGSPETSVDQLFRNKQDGYATIGNQLFKVFNSPPLSKDVFADIVWPKATTNIDEAPVVQFKLNTQDFPCTSYETWFNHQVELSIDGKTSFEKIPHLVSIDDPNQVNPTFEATFDEIGASSFSKGQQSYDLAIVGKTSPEQSVRVIYKEKIIVGKTLSERFNDVYSILYDKKGVIVISIVFLQLIFARYFEWSFNFCFNMFSGTPFEKINKWTRPLLRIAFYRRWIFRRYFDYMRKELVKKNKNTPESAIYLKKTNSSGNDDVRLDDLLLLLQKNEKNIWIDEDSELFSSTLSDTLKKKYFFDKSYSKAWRNYGFIPIFISGKNLILNGEQSWLVNLTKEELIKAKLNFMDSSFFKTILECGDFAIIIDELSDSSEEIRNELMQYSLDAQSIRFLVTSKKIKDDDSDLFEFYIPVG